MKEPNEMTQEQLLKLENHCTVGDLLEYIHKKIASGEITRDSLVLSQRVEDIYFQENGWSVVKKEGEQYHWCLEHNKRVDQGTYLNKEEYPEIQEGMLILEKIPEDEIEKSKDQYHPIWCPVVYKDDKNLYLDLHY